jgi:hypothetical protein
MDCSSAEKAFEAFGMEYALVPLVDISIVYHLTYCHTFVCDIP